MRTRTAGLGIFVFGMVAGGVVLAWLGQIGGFGHSEAAQGDKPAVVQPPRFNGWAHSWLKARAADEEQFTDKTKKVGCEVFFDHYSGNALYILAETGAVAAAPALPLFKLHTVAVGKSYQAYRIEPVTGRTWGWLDGTKWVAHGEKDPIPNGLYDLETLVFDGGQSVKLFRINRNTGRSFFLADNVWNPLSEPDKK
jgi:hypothetical protein